MAYSWVLANGSVQPGAVNQPYGVGLDQLLYVGANRTLWTAFSTPPRGEAFNVTLRNLSSGVTYVLPGVGNVTGWVLDAALDAVFLTEVPPGLSYGELLGVSTHHPDILRAPTILGPAPTGVALDPTTGQLWVTGPASLTTEGNVTVVSATSGAVLAKYPVGRDPTGVAFEPSQGVAFVANSGSDNVTVLNATTGLPAAPAIALPGRIVPGAIAFDGPNRELLALITLGSPTSSRLVVMDAPSGRILASVPVPGPGNGTSLVVDPTTGNAYVATSSTSPSPGVLLRWAPNSTAFSRVCAVGGQPSVQSFDPTTSLDFVGHTGQVYASAVNVSEANAVARPVSYGGGPGEGVYDPTDGRVYVVNAFRAGPVFGTGPDLLEAIDPANGTTPVEVSPAGPGTSALGADLVGVALDPGSGRMFVAAHGWSSSSVLSSSGGSYVANLTLPFAPSSVVDDARRGLVYFASGHGQVAGYFAGNLTPAGTWALGGPTTSWQAAPESLAVDPGSGDVILVGALGTPGNGSPVWFLSPANSSNWSGTLPIASGPGDAVAVSPLDGDAYVATSQGALGVFNVTGGALLATGRIGAAGPDPGHFLAFDPGRKSIVLADAARGQLFLYNATQASLVGSGSAAVPVGPTPEGIVVVPYHDQVVVSLYGSGTVDAFSPVPEVGALSVHLAIPTVGEGVGVVPEDDVGTAVFFDALAGGGTPPVTFAYTGLPDGCATGDTGHLFCVPASAQAVTTTVTISDSLGLRASASVPLRLVPVATLRLSATPDPVDGSQPVVTVNAELSGGVGPFRYVVGFGDVGSAISSGPVTGGNVSLPHPYRQPGSFAATVLVVDALGVRSTGTVTVVIGAPMVGTLVSLRPTNAGVPAGEALDFQARVTGGIPPYSFVWRFPDGAEALPNRSSSNESLIGHTLSGSGAETVRVLVEDGANATLALEFNLTVLPSPARESPSTPWLSLGVGAGGVLVVVAAVLLWRRRRASRPSGDSASGSPAARSPRAPE